MDLIELQDEFEKLKEEYEELFNETEEIVLLDGKILKEALRDQLPLEMSWELIVKKLCNLYDNAELYSETKFAEATKAVMQDKYVSHTFTEAKVYAKADEGYKTSVKLLNNIRHIRDEARGICEVTKTRKYTLKSMTDIVVAGVENHII